MSDNILLAVAWMNLCGACLWLLVLLAVGSDRPLEAMCALYAAAVSTLAFRILRERASRD